MDFVDDRLDAFMRIAQAVAEDIFEVSWACWRRIFLIERKTQLLEAELKRLRNGKEAAPHDRICPARR